MKQCNYKFTRTIYGVTWTVTANFFNGVWDVDFSRGPVPHWHNFSNGTSLWEGGSSSYVGYAATRIQILRFIACGLANLHGFSIGSAHNQPSHPACVHTRKQVATFNA